MNVAIGSNPQIGIAPHCENCGSTNTICQRSQGAIRMHEGAMHRVQHQRRICRDCGGHFPYVLIKAPLARSRRHASR